MHLLFATFFALLPAVLGGQPPNVYTKSGFVHKSALVGGEDPLYILRSEDWVLPNLFNPNNQQHSPHIFASIVNGRQAMAMINFLHNLKDTNTSIAVNTQFPDKTAAARIKAITANDVAMCQASSCCTVLINVIHGMNKDALKKMTPHCLQKFAERVEGGITKNLSPGKAFLLLPENLIHDHGGLIAETLKEAIAKIDLVTFAKIIKFPSSCGRITSKGWEEIFSSDGPLSKLTPECVAIGSSNILQIANFPNVKIGKVPVNLLNLYNGSLPDNFFKSMTGELLSNYATKYEEGQFPGMRLELDKLSPKAAKGLTLRLLLGNIYGNIRGNPLMTWNITKDAWSNVPADIFSSLTEDDSIRLAWGFDESPTLDHLKVQQIDDLLRFTNFCKIMPPVTIRRAKTISTECFIFMKPLTQAAALGSGKKLPADVLAYQQATDIAKWEYQGAEGLYIFEKMKNQAGVAEKIANLGKGIVWDHPCSLITSVDMLKNLKMMQAHMSAYCFSNLGFTLEKDDFASLNSRLSYLQPFKQMKKVHSKEFWQNLTSDALSHMISGGHFCQYVDSETMQLINRKAYSAFTKDCYNQLRMIQPLTKDAIQAFPPAVFADQTSESITGDVIAMLTPEQLAALGSESGDKSPAALFTVDILNKFGKEHLAKITAAQWRYTPDPSFATFSSAERLAAVPAANTVFWCQSKVEKIPEATLNDLSVDQAESIGKSCEAQQSPVPHLQKLNLKNEIKDVLTKRAAELAAQPDQTEGGMSTTTIILIASGVALGVVVIGFVVYKFVLSS